MALAHRLAVATAAATLGLVLLGGLVTSTGSGMAFPDWPTSRGRSLASPVAAIPDVHGKIEHGHRQWAGMAVGVLTVTLAFALVRRDPRRWVKEMGLLAAAGVLLVGLLGGMRVRFQSLPLAFVHACLAHAFFALTALLAAVTHPRWSEGGPLGTGPYLRRLCGATAVAVYLQGVLGAGVRQLDHPVACHLATAGIVVPLCCVTAYLVLRAHPGKGLLSVPALSLAALALGQAALGFAAWLVPSPGWAALWTVAHVGGGALLLGAAVWMAAAARRFLEGDGRPGLAEDLLALAKPRVVLMILAATAAGYTLAPGRRPDAGLDGVRLAWTLLGMALAAGGTLTLNQLLERDADRLMERTRERPVASGRVGETTALAYGALLSVAGLGLLLFRIHPLCAALTATVTASYLFLYTPLKRRTAANTLWGGIPGALPPVAGWAAARGEVPAQAWVLFAILYLWQLPHALAVAMRYGEDLARAGFRLLPHTHPDAAARQIVLNCAALLVAGAAPALAGMAGLRYLACALALGAGLLAFGIAAALRRTPAAGGRLMAASLVYLPALLLAMVLDRLP